MNVASGLNDRISRADPELREVDNILINVLNMDLDNADKLIIESGKEFISIKFIISYLKSDFDGEMNRIVSNGFDPFRVNIYEGGMISRFYYGKYLIDQNKMDEAKNAFFRLANIRGFGFPVGHIKKKSIEIFNSMSQDCSIELLNEGIKFLFFVLLLNTTFSQLTEFEKQLSSKKINVSIFDSKDLFWIATEEGL